MRLGSALGKSLGEIRAMPYPEYRRWKLFFYLEPFGWGALNMMLYNINRGDNPAKSQDELLNDTAKVIIGELDTVARFENMTKDEKRAYIKRQVMKDLGSK